jgi:hypothetical protein
MSTDLAFCFFNIRPCEVVSGAAVVQFADQASRAAEQKLSVDQSWSRVFAVVCAVADYS